MRQFYLTYRIAKSPISQSLSWTHYIRLMRISDPDERSFYEIEAAENNWSVRELNRHFDSALYQRLALSRDKDAVKQLATKGQIVEKPQDILKDPYVLEFTGLPELPQYSESKLEQRLIDELQSFPWSWVKDFRSLVANNGSPSTRIIISWIWCSIIDSFDLSYSWI